MGKHILLASAVILLLGTVTFADDKSPVGKSIDHFSLPDVRTGKPVALADFTGKQAVVLVFLCTQCPINNAYLPRLAELQKEYAGKSVQFLGINCVKTDKSEDVAAHAKKYEIPFPVLKDSNQRVAELFAARRTPEAFVLDARGVIRYRGRIDDRFGIDVQRTKPSKEELVDALNEVLEGKTVTTPETEVAGCLITRENKAAEKATVTFTKDVARILQKNCQECHRPGQIGPMPLISYEDAEGWSAMIREVVTDKRMPPWYADPKIGHFKGDRRLAEDESKALLAWIDQGCPKGDMKDMPAPAEFPVGWKIGKPDVILTMSKPFDVPAESPKGGIPYKYFFVDTNFKEDMWIERAEAKPGATEVVHHIIAFVLPPKDSDEPVPPGPPLLPPFIPNGRTATVLCGTAPGDMPLLLPAGVGRKIPKGSRILFQMHYTPNGRAQSDASSIGLIFCKKPPEYRVLSLAVFSFPLKIPAGDPNYRVEGEGPLDLESGKVGFDEPARVLGFMPHMHLRGKDFFIAAIWPDGTKQALLSVPRFNFNWQNMYRLAEPLDLPVGSRIRCVAHFDNSADNPNNPDPTKTVLWGDQTWQEMMIGWTDVAFKVKKEK